MICQFNGAKDVGEERWDPRFDCQDEATWHLLLAMESRYVTASGQQESVLACEDHAMNVYYSIAMRHRADASTCANPAARWRLTGNCCVIMPSSPSTV